MQNIPFSADFESPGFSPELVYAISQTLYIRNSPADIYTVFTKNKVSKNPHFLQT